MGKKRISLAIVDNDQIVLMGLVAIIRQRLPRVDVAWAVPTGHDAIERALDPLCTPDILLVDMSLEDMAGTAVCREIRMGNDIMPMLAITAFSLGRYARPAAHAGAQGIVGKADFDGVCDMITRLMDGMPADDYINGMTVVSFESVAAAHRRLHVPRGRTGLTVLTERERQVVELYAQANKPSGIAKRLGISPGSVKTHLDRAQERLGLSSRTELVDIWWSQSC